MMSLIPQSAFMRLLLVCGVMLGGFVLLIVLMVRSLSMGSSGDSYAEVIITNIDYARQQQAEGRPLPANVTVHASAPETVSWITGIQHDFQLRLQQHYGAGSKVAYSYGDSFSLWLQEPRRNDWLQVRLPKYLQSFLYSIGWLIALIAAIVLLGAWAASRWVVQPLTRLAEQVPQLNTGKIASLPADGNAPREVKWLRDSLQEAWRTQQQTISNREFLLAGVSHDLRTPLARLRFAIELNETDKEAGRKAMQNDLQEMEDILQQYLDYCRDGSEESLQEFDLFKLVRELCKEAQARGHAWQAHIGEQCLIEGRPLSLRRAIRNLMRNAELHGASPFYISVDSSLNRVYLRVRDHGKGVDESVLGQLSQPFFRVDTARSGATGSGLGLALVARTAELHDGGLHFANLPLGGFMVEFSFARTRQPLYA